MTMPDERFRALIYAKEFLLDLLDPKKTPGVSKIVRRRAASVLRHYPAYYYFLDLTNLQPNNFATGYYLRQKEEVEALYKEFLKKEGSIE